MDAENCCGLTITCSYVSAVSKLTNSTPHSTNDKAEDNKAINSTVLNLGNFMACKLLL